HAPVVLVEGKIVSQGAALNRGVLAETIVKHWVERADIQGTHVFGKERCGHCTRAKDAMAQAGIAYTYHDVVKNPRAVYEVVPRAKKEIGNHTPVTTPQIWIDGRYIGGADALEAHLASQKA
ncbi:MAG: glutaredoxin, partial [Pseudomonadota bacterium]